VYSKYILKIESWRFYPIHPKKGPSVLIILSDENFRKFKLCDNMSWTNFISFKKQLCTSKIRDKHEIIYFTYKIAKKNLVLSVKGHALKSQIHSPQGLKCVTRRNPLGTNYIYRASTFLFLGLTFLKKLHALFFLHAIIFMIVCSSNSIYVLEASFPDSFSMHWPNCFLLVYLLQKKCCSRFIPSAGATKQVWI
jgi:hypothetical protein